MAEVNTRKRGNKWEYYFEIASVDGKRKRISKSGFATKKEALKFGIQSMAEYENTGKVVFNSEISLADFLDMWLTERCSIVINPQTYDMYSNYLNYSIKPNIGKYKLSNITYTTIQSFVNERHEHGWKTGTIKRCTTMLSSAFKWAIKNDYIKSNPVLDIEYPKNDIVDDEELSYTQDQMNEFFEAYKDNQLMYTILMVGYHCGLRISETLGLTWEDIDFENKTMSINKQLQWTKSRGKHICKPKFNSCRVIDLDDNIIKYLYELKQSQTENEDARLYRYYLDKNNNVIETTAPITNYLDFVAIKEDGKENDRRSITVFLGRQKKHGKPVFGTHALRHTHCTRMIQNGVNLRYVQQRLGHKDIDITLKIYNHLNKDGRTSEINKLNNLF